MPTLTFPELRQTYEYDCGANALQSVLVYYGVERREEILIKQAKTKKKIGTLVKDMEKTLKKYGMNFDGKEMTIEDLKKCIDKKVPIIILLQAWSKKKTDYANSFACGHWVVVIGYEKNKIIFEDPYAFKRDCLTEQELCDRWHAKEGRKKITHFGLAVIGKKPVFDPKEIVRMG